MSFKIVKNTFPSEFKKIKSKTKPTLKKGMALAMESFRSGVVEKTPVITGRLVGSLQGNVDTNKDAINEINETNNGVEGFVGSKVEYAAKVEFGSKKNKGFFVRGFKSKVPEMKKIFQNTYKKILS